MGPWQSSQGGEEGGWGCDGERQVPPFSGPQFSNIRVNENSISALISFLPVTAPGWRGDTPTLPGHVGSRAQTHLFARLPHSRFLGVH